MDELVKNIRKFFGGLAGDVDTNAGLTVSQGDHSKTPIPFSYKDDAGEYKAGILYADNFEPFAKGRAEGDFLNNNRAVPMVGIEVSGDTPEEHEKLQYKEAISFLNSLSPESDFKLDFSALVPQEDVYENEKWDIVQNAYTNDRGSKRYLPISEDANVDNAQFMKNLRQLMDWSNKYSSTISPGYFNNVAKRQNVYNEDKERRIYSPELPEGTTSLYEWLVKNRSEKGF